MVHIMVGIIHKGGDIWANILAQMDSEEKPADS